MMTRLKIELSEIYFFLRRNYGPMVVMSMSTLCLMLFRYHHTGSFLMNNLIYFAAIPLLTIVILMRKNPLDFGLRLGDYKVWGFHLLMAFPIIFILVYLGTRSDEVHRYYATVKFNPYLYVLEKAVTLWCWEFFLRGFLLFGLKDKLKESAIFVQMIPFALMHLGKPEMEAISCIFSGIYFGYVCYRTKSFWPAYFIHLFINYCTKFLSVYV